MRAPDYVIEAILETVKWAMIYCSNYSLNERAEISQINELMEAVHEVPGIASRWPEGAIKEIELHLAGFDHTKWKGSPNLVVYFEDALERVKS